MRIKNLTLQQFRSFSDMQTIELDAITVLIGANNAGKSSILQALYSIQEQSLAGYADVRVGSTMAQIWIAMEDVSLPSWGQLGAGVVNITFNSSDRKSGSKNITFTPPNGGAHGLGPIQAREPNHFVVPYLSKRKTATYHEDVRNEYAMQIIPSMQFLAAKLSRISNPSFPGYQMYSETCKAILGFVVTSVPSDGGQRPGVYLDNRETIPIDQMGEGVPNIVALLADLALSRDKLFIIEEPENDLHPIALKALLDLIVESSKLNQFVISTHSNIVLRHLGSTALSRVYEVTAIPEKLPIEAKIRLVEPTPEARIEVLRDLGYSFSDFDLWDGWLFLEEASAERIVRDYLIPWFAPRLARIRTLSTAGVNNVEPTFEDFHRLVRFTHLEKAYKNAAWVRIDGDEIGRKIIAKLQERYADWEPDRFACFVHKQFESYYPAYFQDRVIETLSIANNQERRESKRMLLEEVRTWLDADTARGKAALGESACEIIEDLRKIESKLAI
jgi:hypothetical protein